MKKGFNSDHDDQSCQYIDTSVVPDTAIVPVTCQNGRDEAKLPQKVSYHSLIIELEYRLIRVYRYIHIVYAVYSVSK